VTDSPKRPGRPKGTLRRSAAVAAAEAIRRGEFADIREAAAHYRPAHIGSVGGFRSFVDHVEEELRRNVPRMAIYKVLSQRSRNRRTQPAAIMKRKSELRDEMLALDNP
jgi:hypothetical protein